MVSFILKIQEVRMATQIPRVGEPHRLVFRVPFPYRALQRSLIEKAPGIGRAIRATALLVTAIRRPTSTFPHWDRR
jgi:hypothetical protein